MGATVRDLGSVQTSCAVPSAFFPATQGPIDNFPTPYAIIKAAGKTEEQMLEAGSEIAVSMAFGAISTRRCAGDEEVASKGQRNLCMSVTD